MTALKERNRERSRTLIDLQAVAACAAGATAALRALRRWPAAAADRTWGTSNQRQFLSWATWLRRGWACWPWARALPTGSWAAVVRMFVADHRLACVDRLALLDADRLASQPFDLSQLVALVAATERRSDSRRAGSAGAADAVDVNLGHFGQLVVDDVRNVVTSRPRAAISVATSTGGRFDLNASSVRWRTLWLLLPWMAAARMPERSRCFTILSAPCFVRANTIVRVKGVFCRKCTSNCGLFCCSTK